MSSIELCLCPVDPELGHALPLPALMTPESAGFDLAAAIEAPMELAVGRWVLVPCGFSMALPEGYEGQVRPRSGLALKYGVTVLNAPGTIDADYRGEVKVLLINLGAETFTVVRGMRIAQLVVARLPEVAIKIVDILPPSQRGKGGFGSTGV